MMLNWLFLGLANGGACLATCAAVLVPLFLGEGRKVAENGWLMARFMAGRLAGYLLFGLLAWVLNWLILRDPAARSWIVGPAYLILAGLMLAYGLGKLRVACALPARPLRAQLAKIPWLRPGIPALFGLLTGLNLCPPFLLAFANAALNDTLAGSLGFFLAFFVGTSIYLLPVPLIGLFQRGSNTAALQMVGRLAAALMAVYYALSGLAILLQGVDL